MKLPEDMTPAFKFKEDFCISPFPISEDRGLMNKVTGDTVKVDISIEAAGKLKVDNFVPALKEVIDKAIARFGGKKRSQLKDRGGPLGPKVEHGPKEGANGTHGKGPWHGQAMAC